MHMFLFFKQKTAYEMRISDLSSDVCSSDLYAAVEPSLVNTMAAHSLPKSQARNLVYGWLASELEMPGPSANIGDFDLKQCEIVLLICKHRDPMFDVSHKNRGSFGRNAKGSKRPFDGNRYRD